MLRRNAREYGALLDQRGDFRLTQAIQFATFMRFARQAKLARYRGARPTTLAAGNTVVISTYFDELCTEPCDVAIDVSERPMFFFVRDGTPVSNTFRLNNLAGHITLKVQTTRRGLMVAGTLTLLFLVGIPMFIAATPKVWMAEGRPGPDLKFKRLWRARL